VCSETDSVHLHAPVTVEKCRQCILDHAPVRYLPTTAGASLAPFVPDFLWRLPLNSGYKLVSAVQPRGSGIIHKHVHTILEAAPSTVGTGNWRKGPDSFERTATDPAPAARISAYVSRRQLFLSPGAICLGPRRYQTTPPGTFLVRWHPALARLYGRFARLTPHIASAVGAFTIYDTWRTRLSTGLIRSDPREPSGHGLKT
jgi:hypothetical protein